MARVDRRRTASRCSARSPFSSGLAYARGRLQSGHPFDALPFGLACTITVVLIAAGLFALTALLWHALWHRSEAPYAHKKLPR